MIKMERMSRPVGSQGVLRIINQRPDPRFYTRFSPAERFSPRGAWELVKNRFNKATCLYNGSTTHPRVVHSVGFTVGRKDRLLAVFSLKEQISIWHQTPTPKNRNKHTLPPFCNNALTSYYIQKDNMLDRLVKILQPLNENNESILKSFKDIFSFTNP